MASHTITVRVPSGLKRRIERIAKQTNRSKSDIGAEALEDFAEWNEKMIARIEEGITALERDDIASPEEVAATFARLRRKFSRKAKRKTK